MKSPTFLAYLILCGTVFAQQASVSTAQISIPGVKGVLELDVGPTTWEARVRPDGKETQLRAMNREDKLLISAFLQRVTFPASAESCRAKWWPMTEKSVSMKREDLRQSEKDGMAIVEYIVPEYLGKKLRQKSLHAYLGSRDICAEVHLSKLQFSPADQKHFDDVLATVQLLPEESAPEDQGQEKKNQYLAEASRFYSQQNFAAAAERYQQALDLEKEHRTLGQTFFRVLLDNLSMSYGFTKKFSEARATLEYGITQDPEYPMFYYLLACISGETGQMDESLKQLRLAYKYKANLIPGESMPDPLTDDSFREFVNDKKFVDAVHEMQQQ